MVHLNAFEQYENSHLKNFAFKDKDIMFLSWILISIKQNVLKIHLFSSDPFIKWNIDVFNRYTHWWCFKINYNRRNARFSMFYENLAYFLSDWLAMDCGKAAMLFTEITDK